MNCDGTVGLKYEYISELRWSYEMWVKDVKNSSSNGNGRVYFDILCGLLGLLRGILAGFLGEKMCIIRSFLKIFKFCKK